jgi:hypothetical protein
MTRRMKHLALLVGTAALTAAATPAMSQKMQVGFLWHMHQPLYYPGETVTQTQQAGRFSYSLYDIHNTRQGPYTTWPRNAIQSGLGLANLGAQVSFSGSLMENLNNLAATGAAGSQWNGWSGAYTQAKNWTTQRGNSRLDLIGFSYAHGLFPMLDTRDMRMHLRLHRNAVEAQFGTTTPYSNGFFPAETAFSTRIIPALVAEGFQWTLFDSIHVERAYKDYPFTASANLVPPNPADQRNAAVGTSGGGWVQLNNVWAPSKVAAPHAYRPQYTQYINPATGVASKIIAVPAARYEGNEDGRGGFGALQYQAVMDQYRQYNTDPTKPMFVMLHHDGDNYGGGSDAYYHSNFQNMVNWATNNPNYNISTVKDYLQQYPPDPNQTVHIENGSWAGADNGDPQFRKWNGMPNAQGWSPDRNSWAVLTAAKNRVFMADDISPYQSVSNIRNNTGTQTERAWYDLIHAQASDYWYWDGTEIWDSNVTRGSNLAVAHADAVISGYGGPDQTPPTVLIPQRDVWNPGGFDFGSTRQASDFKVWTYAYDVSGLSNVSLKFRTSGTGVTAPGTANQTYAGGTGINAWSTLAMVGTDFAPPPGILTPTYRALQYSANITGVGNALVDYYVEATDNAGNLFRSDIQHVFVGGVPDITGGFVMDGALDSGVTVATFSNGGRLWYALRGTKLYVATDAAVPGEDRFIYVALTPGAMVAANWGKAGQVARWDAFLGNESTNGWSGWTDAAGATASFAVNGVGILEGVIDVLDEWGYVPLSIYLATAGYATADGGVLRPASQIPASANGNGNIDPNEFVRILPRAIPEPIGLAVLIAPVALMGRRGRR